METTEKTMKSMTKTELQQHLFTCQNTNKRIIRERDSMNNLLLGQDQTFDMLRKRINELRTTNTALTVALVLVSIALISALWVSVV